MALPWVRFDTTTPSHDKILSLLSDPSPKRYQAAFSWSCSIMWSGGAGTDGHIPPAALSMIHGTTATARLLVTYRLWEEVTPHGWQVVNFHERQELEAITAMKNEGRKIAAEKANCTRWHGPNCWKSGRCSRA